MGLASCDETQHRAGEGSPYYSRQPVRHLVGIHAVSAAVRAAGEGARRLDRVVVAQGARNARLLALVEECRAAGVAVRFEPRGALDRLAGARSHQGVVAVAATGPYTALEAVLETAPERCTLVMLDSVQDPRNLGAVIRTADAAGAHAALLPERRSAGLSEAASKAAAGALEALAVVRVKNLGRAIDQLKEAEFWVYGFDARAGTDYDSLEYAARSALVLGGESRGLREKVAERCDHLVRIPMGGRAESLNVSVATGVALFEVARQRRAAAR